MHATGRAVVFDLDGTLVDSAPGIERCLREALTAVAPDRLSDFPAGIIGPPVREMVGGLLPDADVAAIEAGVAAFRRCYDGAGWRETVPHVGATETLTALRSSGHRLFVVTNKPQLPTERIIADLGWDPLFESVVCKDSLPVAFADKPEALGHLVGAAGLDARTAVFVGDSADDARAADVHGMAFVYAAYGYGDDALAREAWASINAIADLCALLDGAEL